MNNYWWEKVCKVLAGNGNEVGKSEFEHEINLCKTKRGSNRENKSRKPTTIFHSADTIFEQIRNIMFDVCSHIIPEQDQQVKKTPEKVLLCLHE